MRWQFESPVRGTRKRFSGYYLGASFLGLVLAGLVIILLKITSALFSFLFTKWWLILLLLVVGFFAVRYFKRRKNARAFQAVPG